MNPIAVLDENGEVDKVQAARVTAIYVDLDDGLNYTLVAGPVAVGDYYVVDQRNQTAIVSAAEFEATMVV